MTTNTEPRRGRAWLLWLPGLAVALGAGAATAHGLFEVAADAGVPAGLAWLYPLITDGLALVAYVSTIRLRDGDRTYAWCVVVLAAGLSGLAQAIYLAGGVGDVPTEVRFGVGAWPAVAAAIVAHLLFLIGHSTAPEREPAATVGTAPLASEQPVSVPVQTALTRTVSSDHATPGVQASNRAGVQPAPVSRR
ncbi:MAG: DUF2637 domain-containing protein, partial [Thermocrispum sp.]